MAQTDPFLKQLTTVKDNLTSQTTTYTITNWTSDVALDCDSTSDGELADVIGTLITDLIAAGVIQGTVS